MHHVPLLPKQFSFKPAFFDYFSYSPFRNLHLFGSIWYKYVGELAAEFEVGTAPTPLPPVSFLLSNYFMKVAIPKSTSHDMQLFEFHFGRIVFFVVV